MSKGKHRKPEELLAYAERMVQKFTALVEQYRRREAFHHARQDFERESKCRKSAERHEGNLLKWTRNTRRIKDQIRNRDLLAKRAARKPQPKPLTAKQALHREKVAKAAQMRQERLAQRMRGADLDYDPRTAAGARPYEIVNFGKHMRANINHFGACIPRPADRTDLRLLAWQAFDRHYSAVCAGLIPSPKYEASVDTCNVPDFPTARLAALQTDSSLRMSLGLHLHHLLVEVVYNQRHPRDLPGLAALEPKSRTVLLLHALDLACEFFDIAASLKTPARRA